MKISNHFYLSSAIIIFSTFLINGCGLVPESFSDTPKISFKSLSVNPSPTITFADSVTIAINFEDGDGDLGLDSDTLQPLYLSNGTLNPARINCMVYPFRKVRNKATGVSEFQPAQVPNQNLGFHGRFPYLKTDEKKGPIEGVLNYGFLVLEYFGEINPAYIQPNDTIRFEVQIVDRARNYSNTITTSEIVVLKRK
jgi:hypothetical protein